MNKKIKVIELMNIIANKKDIPKRIKWDNYIYKYNFKEDLGYYRMDYDVLEYLTDNLSLDSFEDLNKEVEILEDNTEEIEEIKIQKEGLTIEYPNNLVLTDKINELVKAVNQMRKDSNK